MTGHTGHLRLARSPRKQDGGRRHAHNYYLLGMRRADAGAGEEARAHLRRALEFDPAFLPALRALAELESGAGDFPAAERWLRQALDAAGPNADLYFQLGNVALNRNDPRRALEAYRQAEALEDATPELRFNIGLAYLFMGANTEAEAVFNALVLEQPANARVWDALGCARRQRDNAAGAEVAFVKALELDPALNDARDHLAQLLMETADLRRAQQVLESALKIEPERRSSLHLLGMVYATFHDYASAAACWRRLVDLGQASPEVYQSLAAACLRLSDRARAGAALTEMLLLYPEHAQGHVQLGLLLLDEGEIADGCRHLDAAELLAPDDPAVRQALAAARALLARRR